MTFVSVCDIGQFSVYKSILNKLHINITKILETAMR